MAGLGIIIPRTGGSGPIAEVDSLLTNGSLALLDPAHSHSPFTAALPAAGASVAVPNIAWEKAAAVLGSGTDATLAGSLSVGTAFTPANLCKLERSGKSGIHAISPRPGTYMAQRHAIITLPAALLTYLANNTAHAYYFSMWANLTRVTSATGFVPHSSWSDSTASGLWFMGSRAGGGETNYPVANRTGNRAGPQSATTGPFLQNMAVSGMVGAAPVAARNYLWCIGDGYGSSAPGVSSSQVFYRAYLEDLTVSGRSYATVDALDLAAYTAAIGTGGRYNADTYTAPSTVV